GEVVDLAAGVELAASSPCLAPRPDGRAGLPLPVVPCRGRHPDDLHRLLAADGVLSRCPGEAADALLLERLASLLDLRGRVELAERRIPLNAAPRAGRDQTALFPVMPAFRGDAEHPRSLAQRDRVLRCGIRGAAEADRIQ